MDDGGQRAARCEINIGAASRASDKLSKRAEVAWSKGPQGAGDGGSSGRA